MAHMGRKPSVSRGSVITCIGGGAFAAIVIASVLVPLKMKGLLPEYGWPKIISCPFIAFYLLSGVAVTSLVSDRLGCDPRLAKSLLIDMVYLGVMVIVIVAIVAFS
jgi:hypothetical protein